MHRRSAGQAGEAANVAAMDGSSFDEYNRMESSELHEVQSQNNKDFKLGSQGSAGQQRFHNQPGAGNWNGTKDKNVCLNS